MELGLYDGHCYHEARKRCKVLRLHSTPGAKHSGCVALRLRSTEAARALMS